MLLRMPHTARRPEWTESIPDEVGAPRPLHSTNTERHGERDSESELELTYAPEWSSLGIMRTVFAGLAIFP